MKAAILQKYEHYDRQVQTFMDSLAHYPDEQLNQKPVGGGWSPMQVLHHLVLTEELSLAYIRKKLSYQPKLEKVGLGSYWRTFLLHAFLRSPVKFKAPPMIGDSNLPEFATLAETRARWEKIRGTWKQYIGEIPEHLLDKEVYKHPIVGRLGWLQTASFFQGHFHRHRKQAQRALKV